MLALIPTNLASAQNLPEIRPTARDVYVGCFLYLKGTDVALGPGGHNERFSGPMCGLQALGAIAHREGRIEGHNNKLRFCLPKIAEMGSDPVRAMANVYLDYFESVGSRQASADGQLAYTAALIMKWPCGK